ncbi:MAG: hypothetical protein LBR10_11790 [Prevotellaceae bacterium]|nr:hypothetical protein [Prevotellaceae bacterium]
MKNIRGRLKRSAGASWRVARYEAGSPKPSIYYQFFVDGFLLRASPFAMANGLLLRKSPFQRVYIAGYSSIVNDLPSGMGYPVETNDKNQRYMPSGRQPVHSSTCSLIKIKKIFVLTVVLLLTTTTGFAQEKTSRQKTDVEKAGLKGEVKSVKTVTYQAIEKSGKITKGEIDSLHTIEEYLYDSNGNLIAQNSYESGDHLKEIHTYKYDSIGNRIETDRYYSNGMLASKIIHQYDSTGNPIEDIYYRPDGSLSATSIFKYDTDGDLIEENFYDPDGSLSSTAIFSEFARKDKYDNCGNPIETIFYQPDRILFKDTYKYKYDSKGNWTERISYYKKPNSVRKGKAYSITERTITYYEEWKK